jgi:hypothetical protein
MRKNLKWRNVKWEFHCSKLTFFAKQIPRLHGTMLPQAAVCRVAAKILNEQSWIAEKGSFPGWELVRHKQFPVIKNPACYKILTSFVICLQHMTCWYQAFLMKLNYVQCHWDKGWKLLAGPASVFILSSSCTDVSFWKNILALLRL